MGFKDTIKYYMIKAEHPPIIGIRKVVWFLTSGWVLFSLYALYGVFLASTIFLIPFAIVMFKFALFGECGIRENKLTISC